MSLAEYRRKRDFARTAEPEPGKPMPRGKRPLFVVQLHHASRRHYDFRLQVGDALKSWAVPKGPSYDPAVKRMAVEVEDHPLDYAGFEGDIPKGEYGGGHVARFDTGTWSSEGDVEAQLAKGHLRFELFGERLKGGWHLVRSGKPARQPQWLLFKEKDEFAGELEADDLLEGVTKPGGKPESGNGKRVSERGVAKGKRKGAALVASAPAVSPAARKRRVDWAGRAAKLPGSRERKLKDAAFMPQLARLGEAPPAGEQWLHELKWDGYRILATIVDGRVRLWSRNALEWTDRLPDVATALAQLGLKAAAFDGELIAGQGTQQDFNRLQATLSGQQAGALAYVLFDLLHVDGVDISEAPLRERKALLAQLLAKPPRHLAYSSHVEGEADAAYALAAEQGFEGLISKRADRPYRPGRGDDWRKSKRRDSDEFAVVGTTPGKGARAAGFGSLLLARPDGDGGWSYAGRVGSGFDDATMRALVKRLGDAGSATPSVAITPTQQRELGRGARWFAPELVVEVIARGIGSSGVLRQPSLKALRPDKTPADLGDSDRGPVGRAARGAAMAARKSAKKATKKVAKKPAAKVAKTAAKKATKRTRDDDTAGPVRISSPDRVVYPEDGYTKAEVAAYYEAVMPQLLPEIAGRPLSVIRCPDGSQGACFFQKHHTAGLKRVDSVRLKEESEASGEYLVAGAAEDVMELVQFNALEFHPWGSHADRPDRADRIVFDLDPGPEVAFAEVRRAARDVRELLKKAGLESFLRTTGGKGLHVVVPLAPAEDWELVRRFARGFAESLAAAEPERFIAVSTLKKRPGKIFVDYLRNGRGATAVASYSLRARPGAPVAMPLPWSALPRLTSGAQYTLANTPAHLRRRRSDPWAGMARLKQGLARWRQQD